MLVYKMYEYVSMYVSHSTNSLLGSKELRKRSAMETETLGSKLDSLVAVKRECF